MKELPDYGEPGATFSFDKEPEGFVGVDLPYPLNLTFGNGSMSIALLFAEYLNYIRGRVDADEIRMPAGSAVSALIKACGQWGLNCVNPDGSVHFRGCRVTEHDIGRSHAAMIIFYKDGARVGGINSVRVN